MKKWSPEPTQKNGLSRQVIRGFTAEIFMNETKK